MKNFLQKQEIFIANNISVVVKDEEKAELFIRSHKKSLIFKAQQITGWSRKGRPSSKSLQLKLWREINNLWPSLPGLSRRRRPEDVCILSSLFSRWRDWHQLRGDVRSFTVLWSGAKDYVCLITATEVSSCIASCETTGNLETCTFLSLRWPSICCCVGFVCSCFAELGNIWILSRCWRKIAKIIVKMDNESWKLP